ncbi:hypothetical protein LshimejAT787_0210410 [Lyophyllum shimeji]|uniref:Uncharacterized protein n=1 Tax=Lyophyllum shimeji TaxID=47721 RepID=A0A9P3PHA2_LYOSH|nr:hypothetical protein LshimejAT787_0210410 [Lyophyllum shimeji]
MPPMHRHPSSTHFPPPHIACSVQNPSRINNLSLSPTPSHTTFVSSCDSCHSPFPRRCTHRRPSAVPHPPISSRHSRRIHRKSPAYMRV